MSEDRFRPCKSERNTSLQQNTGTSRSFVWAAPTPVRRDSSDKGTMTAPPIYAPTLARMGDQPGADGHELERNLILSATALETEVAALPAGGQFCGSAPSQFG